MWVKRRGGRVEAVQAIVERDEKNPPSLGEWSSGVSDLRGVIAGAVNRAVK